MKKNKTNQVGTTKIVDTKKRNIVVAIAVICAVVILSCVWIIMEGFYGGKFTFKNNTDLKVEYMKATFMSDDWQVSDTFSFENVENMNKVSKSFDEINLNNMEATLQIELKFEGYDQFFFDAGYFNDLFAGNINISLKQIEDGVVKINLEAKNGVFRSSTTDCDESYLIYVKEGYME